MAVRHCGSAGIHNIGVWRQSRLGSRLEVHLADVAHMSLTDKLEVVVRRAAALVPGDAGRRLAELVSPEALAIMAEIVAVWAAFPLRRRG